MLNTIFICLGVAALTYILTAISVSEKRNEMSRKLYEEHNLNLKWQLIAIDSSAQIRVLYNDDIDAYQVVRGESPFIVVFATFYRGDDGHEALCLAEELCETIKRFRYYAAD